MMVPVKIERIVANEVTQPANDGSLGSALYKVPIKLDQRPDQVWSEIFVRSWDRPPQWTSMHRPGIASVEGDRIILDGTTLEEIQKYHRDTLKLVVEEANAEYAAAREQSKAQETQARQRAEAYREHVKRLAEEIDFDD